MLFLLPFYLLFLLMAIQEILAMEFLTAAGHLALVVRGLVTQLMTPIEWY